MQIPRCVAIDDLEEMAVHHSLFADFQDEGAAEIWTVGDLDCDDCNRCCDRYRDSAGNEYSGCCGHLFRPVLREGSTWNRALILAAGVVQRANQRLESD